MTWEDLQDYFKGKYFLIGLTFIDEDGGLIEQYQTNGTVQELDDDGLIKIIRSDGSIFRMPYDEDTIGEAEKGEYREKATGQIIKDPDFIMTWQIIIKENKDLEEIKKYGYVPVD